MGENSLAMIGRRVRISLRQFLELAPEDIVHLQRLRYLTGDVAALGSARINIRLLQQNQISRWPRKEVNYRIQLKTTIDIPTNYR